MTVQPYYVPPTAALGETPTPNTNPCPKTAVRPVVRLNQRAHRRPIPKRNVCARTRAACLSSTRPETLKCGRDVLEGFAAAGAKPFRAAYRANHVLTARAPERLDDSLRSTRLGLSLHHAVPRVFAAAGSVPLFARFRCSSTPKLQIAPTRPRFSRRRDP